MDIRIVMLVLIVRLSQPGNSLPAFNDVKSATDYSNANAPVDTKGFENNVIKANEPLMHLIPMGNIEEVEKFGEREIEQSNKLPSLDRKARCKFSRISWRSRKAKTLRGVSTTPIKRISISGWNSANGEMGDSLKKPDIRAPPVARARDPTNILNNEKTMKRENGHGVGEMVMLPPQTIDPVVVISEGAKTASKETPKNYVCGTMDTKEGQGLAAISQPTKIGIPLNSARATDNPQEIFQNFRLNNNQMTPGIRQPFGINRNVSLGNLAPKTSQKHISHLSHAEQSMYQDTFVGNAMIQNSRNLGEPFVDDEDLFSNKHDVIKAPTNNLELEDCIKNYGLEHCIPIPGELRSYVPSHVGKSTHQDTLKSNAMIQNSRNLGEPFVEDEDLFTNKHDVIKAPTNNLELEDCIKNYGLEHCIPIPGELRSYVPSHVGKSTHQDTLKNNAMIQNSRNLGEPFVEDEDLFSNKHDVIKAPTNNLELEDCIKNYGLEHCIPIPGELRSYIPSHVGKSTHQDTLKSNAMIQNSRNLGEPFVEDEDLFSNKHDVIKAPTNNLELEDCMKNYGLEHCIPIPGELRSYIPSHVGKSTHQDTLKSNAMIQNSRNLGEPFVEDEDLFSNKHDVIKAPTNNLELEDCIKNYGLEHCIPIPGELRSYVPSHVGKSTHQDTLKSNAMIQNTRNLGEPFVDDEDLFSNKHDVIKAPTNNLELDDCIKNYGLEHCIPIPGELRNHLQSRQSSPELKRTSTTSIPDSLQDKSSSRRATAPRDRKLNDSPDSAADMLRETSDEIALARRLLLIPEVQQLALQDTKLFLSDMEDLNTFGLSMAQMADKTPVTLLKNKADSLSTAIEADAEPVAQLAGRTEWNDQQTLPDENLKQYIRNVLHYSGLTAEGVQSEASKNILFRTIQHTLENAGFKVNNAHIWDTLRTVISQTRLPRMNPISVFPKEERTSMIRSTDMSEGSFKRLPFIPVKERVFKDGRWAERSTLLGSNRDRTEPKPRKAQNKKFDSKFTTERMDQALLADSGKASSDELKAIINDVAESAVGKSSPVRSEFITNEEENEKTPIKYYSPADRLLAYRKKIQVPKVMFRLEEKTKDSPRVPRLSPVLDSSFPITSTAHSLPLATENGLKFTKDWSKSTSPVSPYTNSPSSEKFREKPSESGSETVLKEDPARQKSEESQVTESSLEAAKNSKRGTRYQQILNNQMIVSQDQVSNHEKSSLIDGSPSATPEYDPTYFGKISSTSAKSAPNKMSDLTDTDLFYIGDDVKIPLKLTRMSDGSWGLSISEKICESSVKKNCPCNVPNEGMIVQEKRRQKKNTSFTKNAEPNPTQKKLFLLDGLKSSISDVDEPKERRTRSFLENDLRTTSSSPVKKFVEKYNLTLNPKNISNSSGPWKNSATLNNNIGIIGSMNKEESLTITPDSKCTENGKQAMNDISPENEPQLHYDDDVTESPKHPNAAEDENWTIDRGSNEIINSVSVSGNSNDNVNDSLQNEYNDNALQAGNDEVMDRWSWVRDFVDSRRKHKMNAQDMDEAILLKIDDMFESEKAKVMENSIAHNFARTINGSKNADPVKNPNMKLDHGKIAERKFRKIDDSNHTEFGVNSIDSSKESQLVRNNRPRANNQDTDKPNRETLIDKKKLKQRDDYSFARISNVKAKYDDRKGNPILKGIRNVNKKQRNARPYRYQQYVDDEAQERMDVMTGVLYWLKEVFFEPSAESDD